MNPRAGLLTVFCILALAGPGITRADAGVLAIVIDAGMGEIPEPVRDAVEAQAFRTGFREWEDGRIAVYLATSPTDAPAHTAAAAIRDASPPGLILAGELVYRDGDRFQIASGQILVEFRRGTIRTEAAAWATGQGLSLLEQAPHNRWAYLLDAPVSPGRLLALQRLAGTGSVVRIAPLVHDVGVPGAPPAAGVFHSVPRRRNLLGVLLRGDPSVWTVERAAVDPRTVPNLEDWDSRLWLLQYPDEDALIQAQKYLMQMPNVIHAGAAISADPPAILSGYLAVKYKQDTGPAAVAHLLNDNGAGAPRILPYVSNGFLYRPAGYGYSIYDTVTALMSSGEVHYATPDLYVPSRDADVGNCSDQEATAQPSALGAIRLCEAWALTDAVSRKVTVGLLDKGLYAASGYDPDCSELQVEYIANMELLSGCPRSTDSYEPDWCTACANQSVSDEDHGFHVAWTIGASRSGSPLVGINPDASLISVRRLGDDDAVDLATLSQYADTLVWMAGGDPNWSCLEDVYDCTGNGPPLPTPLETGGRSDVINLSFVIEDFLERDCGTDPCVPNEDCIVVCDGAGTCSSLEDALRVLRDPSRFPDTAFDQSNARSAGTVVVAAVGDYGSNPTEDCANPFTISELCYDDPGVLTGTDPPDPPPIPFSDWHQFADLAASPDTIAAASTYYDTSKPYQRGGGRSCWIQWIGDYLDVVVPVGKGTGPLTYGIDADEIQIPFGASSAAAAVISGVASLMLKVSPDLTPEQVQCILRETANTDLFDDIPNWGYQEDCEVVDGYSPCVGYGMADVNRAVHMAQACNDPAWVLNPEVVFEGPPPEIIDPGPTLAETPYEESEGDFANADSEGRELLAVNLCNTVLDSLKPHCPCPRYGEKGLDLSDKTIITGRIIDPPLGEDGPELDEVVVRILECIANGKCTCLMDPNCIRFDLINPYEDIWHDVTFRMCVRDRCWEMPGRFEEWLPGQAVRVTAVIDEMIPAMWRATGELPVIRAFSRGKEIRLPVGR